MSNYHIGQYIKKRREELNVNQDALCYGICDRSTLSRIERGRQEPSYQVLKALLQRLGISENRCQILIGPQEFAIVELQREIVADNVKHDFSAALQKIERLEALFSRSSSRFCSSLCCGCAPWQAMKRTDSILTTTAPPSAGCSSRRWS